MQERYEITKSENKLEKIYKVWYNDDLPEYFKNTTDVPGISFTMLLKMYFLDNCNIDCMIPNCHVFE